MEKTERTFDIFTLVILVSLISSGALIFVPSPVEGHVIINEVAWMGSVVGGSPNANAEWIELKNTGSNSIDLSDWTLKAIDGAPDISVSPDECQSTTVQPNGFFLLVRTNDSVLGVSADCVYTGSLGNAGELLELRSASGSLIDSVNAGDGWPSGDNATKDTMQRTSTGGWITVAPTPRIANAVATASSVDPGDSGSSSSTVLPSTSASAVASSASMVRVTAGNDRIVIVGVDARFEGAAYDAGNHIVEAQLRWNFGDGTSALGRTAIHRWEYPGRYAVVLEATRFGEVVSQRITVSAEEAQIGFSLLPDGGVLLENNSTRDTDLSNWRISNRGLIFTFPSNTIVLRGSSIRLSPMALHFSASAEAGLLYPNGDVAQYAHIQTIAGNSGVGVDVEEDVALTVATSSASSESSSETPAVLSVNEIDDSFDTATEIVQSEDVASVPEEEPISESESTRQVAAVATDVDTSSKTSFVWWFGAILVMGLGTIAVSLAPRLRRRATSSASNVTHVELKDWNIIEDIEETR